MKKIGFILFFGFFLFELFCSHSGKGATYSDIQANRERITEEIMKRLEPNGCGAYGTPKWLLDILNAIGEKEICDQHDIDYATLGMSRYEADMRLYNNMRNKIYENYFHILSILQNSTDARAISLYHRIYLLEAESGRLLLGEAIAFIYFSFIRVGGGSAYEKAQADARAYKERMGNSYYSDNYGTGKDSNSNSFGYDENGYWYDDDFDF